MASVRERVSKDRSATTYSVVFRHRGRQTSQTFRKRKDAQDFCDAVNNRLIGVERALEMLTGPAGPARLTVDELAAQFLEWKTRDVTARTMETYRRDYANWIKPAFGPRDADDLDERGVQAWVDDMAKKLSPKSVADRHMLLHQIYRFGKAKSRRMVDHNPCEETELPKVGRKRPKGTTVPEWRAILASAHERNPDAEDLTRFLGSVGWRFSEGIALPVKNVEERRGRVWVDMTQVFRMVSNRQVLSPDSSKTFAGFRRVEVLNDETCSMLRRRIVGKGPEDLVFSNSRGNHWNQQTFLRDTWPGLLTAAGLWNGPNQSPTPHWLRHMAVAVLAAGGASAYEIQRYIGHEDSKTTLNTYGGMIGGMSGDVRDRVNEILDGHGATDHVVLGEVVVPELS